MEHISLFICYICSMGGTHFFYVELNNIIVMTFKEDFKPSKVYNKLVNDVCYNADCLEEFENKDLLLLILLVIINDDDSDKDDDDDDSDNSDDDDSDDDD